MTAHANALYVRRLKGFSNSIREYVNGLEVWNQQGFKNGETIVKK
jgi:hypothetical protein